MREKTYLSAFAIKGEDANDFNEQLKAFCQSHTVTHITFHSTVPFLAYCDYEESEPIIVTTKDKCEYKGESHTCGECPYLERTADRRRKKLICMKSGKLRYRNSHACDELYEQLKGELNEVHLSETGRSNERVES